MIQVIRSLLDTDLYKFTQMQAVLFSKFAGIAYDSIDVKYGFINRRPDDTFDEGFLEDLCIQIDDLKDLSLEKDDREFLGDSCPYLRRSFLDFLSGFRFDPSLVRASVSDGELTIEIAGPWYKTILFEVPLMAIISEIYFARRGIKPDYLAVRQSAAAKLQKINEHKILVSDFGTRRRFSGLVQDMVVSILKDSPYFTGTSNLLCAKNYNLRPIGTNAHEWYSCHAALFGYQNANYYALEAWANEFDGALGHALPDTFTSKVFLRDFRLKHAKLFDGLRQDSGEPNAFVDAVVARYRELRIDPMSKTIIFSDGLDIDKAIAVAEYCKGKIQCAFGIGTHLTNDVAGARPLNMVIKMIECNGHPTVKLSDVSTKNTGDPEAVKICKATLGIA